MSTQKDEFMLRYNVQDVHVSYQQQYERIPFSMRSDDYPLNRRHETVRMATVTLPYHQLEQIMYDLEMKETEIHIRRTNPAALDAYQKYRMLVELLK